MESTNCCVLLSQPVNDLRSMYAVSDRYDPFTVIQRKKENLPHTSCLYGSTVTERNTLPISRYHEIISKGGFKGFKLNEDKGSNLHSAENQHT